MGDQDKQQDQPQEPPERERLKSVENLEERILKGAETVVNPSVGYETVPNPFEDQQTSQGDSSQEGGSQEGSGSEGEAGSGDNSDSDK